MSLFLIDIGKPITFVHIPKTGGTSIRKGHELSDFHLYDPEDYWPSPTLAVVRDPYDRLESCWRDFRYLRPQINVDFPTFVRQMTSPSIERIISPHTPEHHAVRMTHPLHGLQHADFIIHYDNLQSEFNEFCESIDIEPYQLPHYRKAGDHPHAPRTPELEALIRQIYVKDYDFLENM